MKKRQGIIIFIYLGVWFVLNLLFLSKFPFMHSDESWLSGLSRAMMSGGPGVTEPFFDLLPRYPHAIKILFHAVQMPFIAVFGYNLFAVRLVSLVFGTAALYVFYRLCRVLFKGEVKALIMTAVLSCDVQFIYASHMARQEIIITFGLLLALYYVISRIDGWTYKNDIMTGVLIGVFIGVHPNSLMIAFAAGLLYVYYVASGRLKIRNLLTLALVVAAFAGLFVGISCSFDEQFLQNYAKIGKALGIDMTMLEKVQYLPGWFGRLFTRVSGTYYTPPVQLQLLLFGAGVAGAVVTAFFKRDVLKILLPIVGVVAATMLIGRYSQPGVVLLFPLCWLLVFWFADKLPKVLGIVVPAVLAAAVLAVSLFAIVPSINDDYDDYISEIEQNVPEGSMALANLNAEYAFDEGKMLDYRNLAHLDESGISFEEYVRRSGIEYIVYPQEMDFIAERRPVWNIVYGNVIPYYDDMKTFLEQECSVVAQFTSPYAMRIVRYSYAQEWKVTIYKVGK